MHLKSRTRQYALYTMLAPYLLGTLLLVIVPTLIAVGLAFTTYDGFSAPTWTGLDNFVFIGQYNAFLYAVRNTVGFIVLAVPLRLLAMLALALLLRARRRGGNLYRVAVYLPTIIPDIAYALLWTWIFNPVFGPVNIILPALGLPAPAWMVNRNTTGIILLIMSLFQVGEGFVVLLAALADIPAAYSDSAALDGATSWQIFRYITFPLLRPWLALLTFRDIVVGSQAIFTPAFIMMGGERAYAAWFLPQMLYEEAFGRFRFGVASAVMVVWLLTAGLLLALAYRVVRGWGYADDLL
ncbi:MAG TPA: sugar ABC transporter permease [Aggregatilineales bacterium]|nr:sugar ABC transporter permease [Aggregatilineales bacterium]